MIPTMRSLPAPHALGAHLADRYGLGFTGCTLLRSLVNDVYELTTGDARYVLKRSGRNPLGGRALGTFTDGRITSPAGLVVGRRSRRTTRDT